jgi:C-terminal processing protease CtpA/Prc
MKRLAIIALAACGGAVKLPPPSYSAVPPPPDPAAEQPAESGPYHDPDHARGALPSTAQRKDELASLRDHLDRMYAHRQDKLARAGLDEDKLFGDAEDALIAAKTWAAYDEVLYDLLAKLHDDHLTYHPPKEAAPRRGYTSYRLGLTTVLADDHLLVASVDPGSAVAAAGVAPGDDVIAIDGRATLSVLTHEIDRRVWSRPEGPKVAFARTWTSVLVPVGDPPRARRIRVRKRVDGTKVEIELTPHAVDKQEHPRITHSTQRGVDIVTIRSLDGNDERAKEIDDALAAVRGSAALVLDLRADRGGVDKVGYRVVGALAEGTPSLGSYRVLVSPETAARRPKWKHLVAGTDGFSPAQPIDAPGQPAGGGFHGKLAVVVDAGCASTCEVIAAALRADLHAVIVGATTGGSSGAPVEITLPVSHGKVAIPTWELTSAEGKPIEGDGVKPDVDAEHTPEALAQGVDAPLAAAIDRVKP